MRRIIPTVVALALISGKAVQGQDFGKFLEREVKKTIRNELAPPPPNRAPEPQRTAPVQSQRTPPAQPYRTQTAQTDSHPYAFQTADGWHLVVHRYKPANPKPGVDPVILCHGLTYNAIFWDLEPNVSFARYLQSLGYDVWAVSLRGSGMSSKWIWKTEEAGMAIFGGLVQKINKGQLPPGGYTSIDPKYADYTMDSHIVNDVTAVVAFVRKQTGSPTVSWVGHSMGGIVAIAHLARFQNPGISKLVAIGSQVTMPKGHVEEGFLDELVQSRQAQLLGQMDRDQMIEATKTTTLNLFFNVQNVQSSVYEALSTWAADVPAIGLMKQYMTLSKRGELIDASGKYSYARNLQKITIPVLFACGAADRFAPPVCQKYMYEHVGSTDKSMLVFGRAAGLSVDCGHDDAIVGVNSRTEVWPKIEHWLAGPH